MKAKQQYLWTALITPFAADGAVDYAGLAELIKQQDNAGNGILLLGSTGEAMALAEDEKREIVRVALSLKTKSPIMVGVPNINLAQTLAWVETCRGLGIDAYLAATPAYSKPASQGQCGWFCAVMDAADAPVMLYNVPSRTGASLSPDVLRELRGHKNFWAIKESSGGLDAYVDYASAAPNIALYCGDDNILPSAAPLGACGLVSVASNVWPDATHAYVDACRAGVFGGQDWWKATKALFSTTSPVPLKALMQLRGMIASNTVRLPLSIADLGSTDALKQADAAIAEWHKNYSAQNKGKAA